MSTEQGFSNRRLFAIATGVAVLAAGGVVAVGVSMPDSAPEAAPSVEPFSADDLAKIPVREVTTTTPAPVISTTLPESVDTDSADDGSMSAPSIPPRRPVVPATTVAPEPVEPVDQAAAPTTSPTTAPTTAPATTVAPAPTTTTTAPAPTTTAAPVATTAPATGGATGYTGVIDPVSGSEIYVAVPASSVPSLVSSAVLTIDSAYGSGNIEAYMQARDAFNTANPGYRVEMMMHPDSYRIFHLFRTPAGDVCFDNGVSLAGYAATMPCPQTAWLM